MARWRSRDAAARCILPFDRAAVLLGIAPVAILPAARTAARRIFRVYLLSALPFAAFLAAGWFYPDGRLPTDHMYWDHRGELRIDHRVISRIREGGMVALHAGRGACRDIRLLAGAAQLAADRGHAELPHASFKNARIHLLEHQHRAVASIRQVLANPAACWPPGSDPRYAQGYVIITRSQTREANGVGVLPRGALGKASARCSRRSR